MAEEGPCPSASPRKSLFFLGLFRGDTRRSLTQCQALATVGERQGAAQPISPETFTMYFLKATQDLLPDGQTYRTRIASSISGSNTVSRASMALLRLSSVRPPE